ncbi:kinesin-like protein KIF13A isoform X2 [Pecten maximus]|uniref:kinesin-like protein KIF13A isoform X2 n=1 Tax=Pecten maximus TaxID=6579 RepID=UPI0014589A8B|nr:kinesin-like protein KIF13A isoform X2 [Pecten maximus]
MAENVKVAVRVRPFNDREKERNATLVIKMAGKTTEITNPEEMSAEPKKFHFDYSYWSHDEFNTRPDGYMEPTGTKYADQKRVFDDLGRGVLENAWKGYNCSLFAYGQTGSGKTYSMVGYQSNKGIVPMVCTELFSGIDQKRSEAGDVKDKGVYEVMISMLEIYNEQVRDLLNSKTIKNKGSMKIKSDAKRGFYVEALTTSLVNSYPEIENKINEGTKNRTVASTNMNATSSRAHTIVAVHFKQVTKDDNGQSMTKTSVVNLVDLAGSERVASTGAQGDRLKEGSSINQSLSSLGNVINALAMNKPFIPYRDSALTKLLKNALGGNSKTIMIAALSPADINYKETLSTLRFADRAKAIKTTATVNENPTDKLIRELREENARLLKLLKEGGITAIQGGETGATSEEKRLLEEQLQQNQKEMDEMKTTWEQRLEKAQKENQAKIEEEKKMEEHKKVTPHFWNLNEDAALSGMVVHFCDKGKVLIGSKAAETGADIPLSGLGIQPNHAEIVNKEGTVLIVPVDTAKVTVNGQKILAQTRLHHHDRVLFGANALYIFHHPSEASKLAGSGSTTPAPTFDQAQQELAMMAGLVSKDGTSKEDLILQEEVTQVLRIVNEANAMSEEMDKKVKFEVALLAPAFRSLHRGPTEVRMKVKDLITGNHWMWTKDKAIHRHALMQQLYQDFISKDENWNVSKENDPFWEPADTEMMIGIAHLNLLSLAYKCSIEENADIHDHKTQIKGHLQLEVVPCDKNKQPVEDIELLEDTSELVGKDLTFMLKVNGARGLPTNIQQSYCKFKFYLDNDYTQTEEVTGIAPDFDFEKLYQQNPVTQQFLNYLRDRHLVIEVWGRQKGDQSSSSKGNSGLLPTKDLMIREKTFIGKSALEAGDSGEKKKKKKKKRKKEHEIDDGMTNGIIIPVPPPGGQQSGARENMSTMTLEEEKKLKDDLARYQEDEQKLIEKEKKKAKTKLKETMDAHNAEMSQKVQEMESLKSQGRKLHQENMENKKTLEAVRELLSRTKEKGKSTISVSDLAKVLDDPSVAQTEELGANTSKACVLQ